MSSAQFRNPLMPILRDVSSQRKRGINELSANSFLHMNGSANSLKRPRLDSHVGTPMPTTRGPLDGLYDNLAGTPFPTPPITSPARQVNQHQTYNRIVKRAPKGSSPIDTVSKFDWALLHRVKGDPNAPFTNYTRDRLSLQMEDGSAASLDMVPVTMLSVANFNDYLLRVQQHMFQHDRDTFLNLTPADVMKDWSLEGVCIGEEMLSGAESQRADGFSRRGIWLGEDGFKVATLSLRGEDHCKNIFGESVVEGGTLFFILKKWDRQDLQPQIKGAGNMRFKPFLMGVKCVEGGQLPPSYVHYKDEYGVDRYDAEVISGGYVLINPQDGKSRPVSYDATSDDFMPLLDRNLGRERDLIKIIVNPQGWNPMGSG